MSLPACLPGLVQDGKISQEQADRAGRLFAEAQQDFRRQFNDQTAAKMASDDVLKKLEYEATRKRFLTARKLEAQKQALLNVRTYDGGDPMGPMNAKALPAIMDYDPRADFSNVEGRRKAVVGDAHRRLDDLTARFSTNIIGQTRNKADLVDTVKELFGTDSGNPAAKALAQAWRETAEELRQRYNSAGGNIGKLELWGLPQSHDWEAVRDAGFGPWRDFVEPLLDRTKMIDRATGKPMSDARLETVLLDVWDTISTNGLTDATPGAQGGKMLANRRGDRRVLIFEGGEKWLAYNDKFGRGSAYDAMMAHVEGMSRDIAAMEILGPNPESTLRWLRDVVTQEYARDRSPGAPGAKAVTKHAGEMTDMWNQYVGALNEPRNEKTAMVFSAYRNLKTSASLGSAFLSANADFAFTSARASLNGLTQTRMMADYAKLMAPGSLEDQKLAIRRGLIAEEWSRRTERQHAETGLENTGNKLRIAAEATIRASLLARHTQSLRWVNGMEWLSTFTENTGKAFDELDPRLQRALQKRGIEADGWEKLRNAPKEMDRGVEWITPRNTGDRDLASRFMEMIHAEANLAVPTPSLRTQAYINSNFKRGNVLGEIARSAFLFKSFGVTVFADQAREIAAMGGVQAAKYAMHLGVATTMMGGLSVLMLDIANGRDPREVDGTFWLQAMLQGGGLGIMGDFLKSAENRMGGGFTGTLAGPIGGDVERVLQIGHAAATGGNWQSAAIKAVKGMTPGGNLWYTRLALDRMLTDTIQQLADPNYLSSWRRSEQWAAEQGTQYFWGPGQSPGEARAPDLANAIGENQ